MPDERAAAGPHHRGAGVLEGEEGAREVDAEHVPPLLGRHRDHRADGAGARRGDAELQRTGDLGRGGDRGRHVVLVPRRRTTTARTSAPSGASARRSAAAASSALLAAPGQRHRRAVAQQVARARQPDAAPAARDQRRLPGQDQLRHRPPPRRGAVTLGTLRHYGGPVPDLDRRRFLAGVGAAAAAPAASRLAARPAPPARRRTVHLGRGVVRPDDRLGPALDARGAAGRRRAGAAHVAARRRRGAGRRRRRGRGRPRRRRPTTACASRSTA